MTAFLIENMAPVMFFALVVLLLLGYPVAFALAANGIAFGLIGIELGIFAPSLFQALPERLFAIMGNETLLAVPFFTFRAGHDQRRLDRRGECGTRGARRAAACAGSA
jgi:TRAP-type mannitol/chloroaromatic compound transport system permease large subunit